MATPRAVFTVLTITITFLQLGTVNTLTFKTNSKLSNSGRFSQPLSEMSYPYQHSKRSTRSTSGLLQVVVELAIVCDVEFGQMFQFDRRQILDYWSIYLEDLNLRFASLPSSNISFHLTSLTLINNTRDQPFIETNRREDRTKILTKILNSFAEWMQENQNRFPHFDVPLLTTAFNEDSQYGSTAWNERSCSRGGNMHLGSIVLHQTNKAFNYIHATARKFAQLFAAHDENRNRSGCNETDNILRYQYNDKHYFFSKCTDKIVAGYLRSAAASCLRRQDGIVIPEFLDLDEVKVAPSIRDQCSFINNISKAETIQNEENCYSTKCYERIGGQLVELKPVYPVTRTPCGDDKLCFRSRCLARGFRIKNVGADKCLLGSNRFSYNDLATLQVCPSKPSPLDQFVIKDTAELGKFLATPYSTTDTYENEDKCLTVDLSEINVQFQRCATYNQYSWYGWDLIKADRVIDNAFLLYHRRTKKCVKANEINSDSVSLDPNCDPTNSMMLWIFYERIPPKNMNLFTFRKSLDKVDAPNPPSDQYPVHYFVYVFLAGLATSVVICIVYVVVLKFVQRTDYSGIPIYFTTKQ